MKRDSVDSTPGESGTPASRQGAAGGHNQILSAFTELEASFSGLKKMQMEAAQREAELTERAEQLDKQRAELESRLGSMSRERSKLAEERDHLQRERAELAADSETVKAKWREVSKALEQAEQQVKTNREGSARDVSGLQARLAEATGQVASLKAEIAHLKSQLEEAAGEQKKQEKTIQASKDALKAAPGKDVLAKHEKAIQTLNQKLETATEKLDEASARNDALQQELEAARNQLSESGGGGGDWGGGGGGGGASSEHQQRRRARLRRYRELLQAQAGKIVQAQNALAKRHAECDQVMAQRGRLSLALVELQRREQRVSGFKARTAATIIVFYTVIALMIVAVMCYFTAGKLRPATYVARAVIEADPRGKTLSTEEIQGWQSYHEQLLEDPGLMEMAAQRLDQRGFVELGRAPQLREKVLKDMYVTNTTPGKLVVEMRGKGADRTAMMLDTYINAMVSTANAARGSRTDGVATVISQTAKPNDRAFIDPRMPFALTLFGGAGTFVVLVSTVFGSRLARAKWRADAPESAARTLDDADAWKGNDQREDGSWNTDSTKPVRKKKK